MIRLTDKKGLNIGGSDFKEIIEKDHYYVDKSLLIADIIEDNSKVKLITRPRRFGKTLNMSMLKYFFDIREKEENKHLFDNLNISKPEYNKFKAHQGEYPVIYITLKNINGLTYEDMLNQLMTLIRMMFRDNIYLKTALTKEEAEYFDSIVIGDIGELSYALMILSDYLNKYYNKKVIILIDEYDSPILTSQLNGYYKEATNFFRGFYGSALKDNVNLEMSVITGISRIAKEGNHFFHNKEKKENGDASPVEFCQPSNYIKSNDKNPRETDLEIMPNNLKVYSILEDYYSEYFGFTEEEVFELLRYYELEDYKEGVKLFYDGYRIGDTKYSELYNPFAIINFAFDRKLGSYWTATGSEKMIEDIAKKDLNSFIKAMEVLLNDESVMVHIDKDLVYNRFQTFNDIWTLLFHTGYLTLDSVVSYEDSVMNLKVPNNEIKGHFKQMLKRIYRKDDSDVNSIMELLFSDFNKFENILNKRLIKALSYYDQTNVEANFHNLMLGLFISYYDDKRYIVKSNIESGLGRPDLMLTRLGDNAELNETYIFELKPMSDGKSEEQALDEAISQINAQKYCDGISGIVHAYGVTFNNKKCVFKEMKNV